MVIFEYPKKEKLNIPSCVLALGFFDGVHIAHRDLLSRAALIAKENGLAFGVFTFASDGGIKKTVDRLSTTTVKRQRYLILSVRTLPFMPILVQYPVPLPRSL